MLYPKRLTIKIGYSWAIWGLRAMLKGQTMASQLYSEDPLDCQAPLTMKSPSIPVQEHLFCHLYRHLSLTTHSSWHRWGQGYRLLLSSLRSSKVIPSLSFCLYVLLFHSADDKSLVSNYGNSTASYCRQTIFKCWKYFTNYMNLKNKLYHLTKEGLNTLLIISLNYKLLISIWTIVPQQQVWVTDL